MEKKQLETDIKIRLYTTFTFVYEANAINVAMSLAQAGYFINISRSGSSYRVDIYERF